MVKVNRKIKVLICAVEHRPLPPGSLGFLLVNVEGLRASKRGAHPWHRISLYSETGLGFLHSLQHGDRRLRPQYGDFRHAILSTMLI